MTASGRFAAQALYPGWRDDRDRRKFLTRDDLALYAWVHIRYPLKVPHP
jgi:hypothetical protein